MPINKHNTWIYVESIWNSTRMNSEWTDSCHQNQNDLRGSTKSSEAWLAAAFPGSGRSFGETVMDPEVRATFHCSLLLLQGWIGR